MACEDDDDFRKSGLIIAIESFPGIDLSTQKRALTTGLRGITRWGAHSGKIPIYPISFPDFRLKSGTAVAEYFKGIKGLFREPSTKQHPYFVGALFAMHHSHAKETIEANLKDSGVVLISGYVERVAVEEGAKISQREDRKAYFEWQTDLEYRRLHLPASDVVVMIGLKGPHEALYQRVCEEFSEFRQNMIILDCDAEQKAGIQSPIYTNRTQQHAIQQHAIQKQLQELVYRFISNHYAFSCEGIPVNLQEKGA